MKSRSILLAWIIYLAFSAYLLTQHTKITSDLTFFLPKVSRAHERLLFTASREGPGSRMLLAEIRGGSEEERFLVSDAMVMKLRASNLLTRVQNGIDPQDLVRLEEALFEYRFLLTPSPFDQWDISKVHHSLQKRATALYSSSGRLEERWLEKDPLGYWKQYLDQLTTGPMPPVVGGHWVDQARNAALILIETRAAGFDLESQELAQQLVQSAFKATSSPEMTLTLGGAGTLAVETNRNISREAAWLSLANTLMVSTLLLGVYRSWRFLVLGLIPLLTGLLTGALAIRLQFGSIHAITLGFGSTLLGVAADYPNHFFTHLNPNTPNQTTMQRLWPTLRLGILTNVAGFGVMFFSGFRGLQEIGIFASAGLIGAGLATRFILPQLAHQSSRLRFWLANLSENPVQSIPRKARFHVCILIPLLISILFELSGRPLFNDDLATLNPVASSRLEKDLQLQMSFHIPDMRWLVLVTGPHEEDALARSEKIKPVLSDLVTHQAMTGFNLVTDVLPSQKTQLLRRNALPTPESAMKILDQASIGTPFKPHAFEPMIHDLAQYSRLSLLSHDSFRDTILDPRVNSEILITPEAAAVLVPLEGIKAIDKIRTAVEAFEDPEIQLIDLQEVMRQGIRENRREASRLLLMGLLTIAIILAVGLHSLREATRVILPMILASVSTGLLLALISDGLNVYHLASLLLVMGLSLDQALFFNRPCSKPDERARTHLSILLCSLSSILAFGGLAFASVPLLSAIGMTVSIGAFLAVTFAALLAK